ncbi:MAG: ABC transporter transmembrane domain-containing protein, partial [Anaerolineae bacterium]|nr:ABC transporter transmembrane domain-containing protein [Anaerolineae bacterium]
MSVTIGPSSPGMGPRGAIDRFGEKAEGHVLDPRVILRLLVFLRPHWRRMLAAFGLTVVASGLTLAAPFLIKEAIDGPIAQGDLPGLRLLALLMAATFLGLYLAKSFEQYLLSWVGQRVLATMRAQLYRHLQALPLGFHDTHIVGVTVSRVINDVAVINELLSQGLLTVVADTLLLCG